jgi:hypothetical protein
VVLQSDWGSSGIPEAKEKGHGTSQRNLELECCPETRNSKK